jgi:zeaxanthin glucosyltransferase
VGEHLLCASLHFRMPSAVESSSMATIVFSIWPMASAMGTASRLARDLRARGHRVVFLGLADCADYTEPNGFELAPIFERWFPRGSIAAMESAGANVRGLAFLRKVRAFIREMRALTGDLVTGRDREIEAALGALRPDLLLISSSSVYPALPAFFAFSLGIPCAYLTTLFPFRASPLYPPFTTDLVPRGTALSRARCRLAWTLLLLKNRLRDMILAAAGLDVDMRRLFRRLAAARGFPAGRIREDSLLAPVLDIPELYVCPRALDFPGAARAESYLGAAIDLGRSAPDFPWDRLQEGRPLLYVSLGTYLYLGRRGTRDFLQKVLDGVGTDSRWQLVLAAGDEEVAAGLRVPPGAVVVVRAPQLALLERAGLAITHGGITTLQESLYFGVPVVVFPLGFDQPGIAARVVYHGVGARGEARRATPAEIRRLVETVLGDPAYADRARALGKEIRADMERAGWAEAIERLIARDR